MSSQQHTRPPTRRPPLGEATRRVVNSQQHPSPPPLPFKSSPIPHHESLRQDGLLQVYKPTSPSPRQRAVQYSPREERRAGSPGYNAANPRLSAISKEHPPTNSNRNSQISTVSTNASDKIKKYIGPWKLGKTLGKGATARVRLARHATTGQEAAIKIVQKKNAQMSQAGSLADLDKAESRTSDLGDGVRKMPIGIEREVAIMKLIQHPNIMKLYDIWENRTEIYLVLEYVDNGELFEHITAKGRLHEEEAIRYFRQILSAVGYCHSFNICHRDLKPENILLNRRGEIKIADFGMAALHQTPDHKLKTSCGSPHYAAPELIRGVNYRGDKVDIWSMGVILYASLCGRLPFDVDSNNRDWLGPLLAKIKKGSYDMAPEFTNEAADLIWRILQVNPKDRISLIHIWRHPLLRKYDYLDQYGGGSNPQFPSIKDIGNPMFRRSDIDRELLRHLRSLWHTMDESELEQKLMSEQPNDQKMFYGLFLKYREAQLENYTPDVGHSTSDYHHTRPPVLTKAYSTCHFPRPNSKGHDRHGSRFTVISNVAETVQSYDPFKASRPQHLDAMRTSDRAKVTIHRGEDSTVQPRKSSRTSTSKSVTNERHGPDRLVPPRGTFTSRSSLASSTRSRNSGVRVAVPYKRGVSFSHLKKPGMNNKRQISADAQLESSRDPTNAEAGLVNALNYAASTAASSRYIRSRKAQANESQQPHPARKPGRVSHIWNEDVRQLSSSLAKDCDEAFNRISSTHDTESGDITPISDTTSSYFETGGTSRQPPPLIPTASQLSYTARKLQHPSAQGRPLPPPPARSDSVDIELQRARREAEKRKVIGGGSPRYLDRMVSHIDRLIQPGASPVRDKRVTSAPVDSLQPIAGRALPSIYETRGEDSSPRRLTDFEKFMDHQQRNDVKSSRIASAPEPRMPVRNQSHYPPDQFTGRDTTVRDTIRVVPPSSPSPVKAPAPLTIRKKSSQGGPPLMTNDPDGSHSSRHRPLGLDLRHQYHTESKADASPDLSRIDEDQYLDDQLTNESSTGTVVKKKSNWFKRNSKDEEHDNRMSIGGVNRLPSQSSSTETTGGAKYHAEPPALVKKKGFSFGKLFKKRSPRPGMSVGDVDTYDDDDESIQGSLVENHRQSRPPHIRGPDDARARAIEPQQNWLAKLFNVKPAAKYICFSTSKRKARHEIVTILKAWKTYGIRDIQVDKERNIVFGRVAAKNYFDMKEVSFAIEIMTVIEHGKRAPLSIARLTQERGAGSSFQKVVETLETVAKGRGLLVADERKKKMMVKTLNMST